MVENPFAHLNRLAGPEWLAYARARRSVLIITASSLGLPDVDPERLDALVRDGKPVAAVAVLKIDR